LTVQATEQTFIRLHADHLACFERLKTLLPLAAELAETLVEVLRGGGKLLLAGNGGSAADSQHIATELTVRFERSRRALPAIALSIDTSTVTAAGNDFGFEQIFARQVEALGQPGDLLIGITTSGNSPNIIAALRTAREIGLRTACLTGRGGGKIFKASLADRCLVVPSNEIARVQEAHIFLGHLLCSAVDEAFAS
jgi:D-sedoheptulose 7-phosphate isomerase